MNGARVRLICFDEQKMDWIIPECFFRAAGRNVPPTFHAAVGSLQLPVQQSAKFTADLLQHSDAERDVCTIGLQLQLSYHSPPEFTQVNHVCRFLDLIQ